VSLASSPVDAAEHGHGESAGNASEAESTNASEAETADGPQAAGSRTQYHTVPSALASFAAAVDASPQAILQREQRAYQGTPDRALSDQDIFNNGSRDSNSSGPYDRARQMQEDARSEGGQEKFDDRTPPRHGIAPEPTANVARDLAARSGMADSGRIGDKVADRGLYGVPGTPGASFHPSDRMKEMYEMGDSPSCATCGAIMTRSGSCYRCMSCGSTSGCS
jgi:hypothetical protein